MSNFDLPEIHRRQWRGEPVAIYYALQLAMRAHEHNYLLRLISDWMALRAPSQFSLLPQYQKSLNPSSKLH
jgi:hypothetical protein